MASTNSGYVLSALSSLLLLLDNPGALAVVGVLLYLTPATSALGAVVLTACLGGTAVRDPSFPIYVGLMMWTGLFERDARLRAAVFRGRSSP